MTQFVEIHRENVKVRCPKCGQAADGHVVEYAGFPFAGYSGYCKSCDYNITESEWEEA